MRIVTITAAVGAAAVVAWALIPSSGEPAPATPSSRIMTAVPSGASGGSLRLVPPSSRKCTRSDLSLEAIPQVPGRNGYISPAVVGVQSRRSCRIHQRGQVTPLHPDGRPAAPPVILQPPGPGEPVTVSPGHAARLVIDWGGVACPVKPGTPRATLATSFSYDIDGVNGRFPLPKPVEPCPMGAWIESDDTIDVATKNVSHHRPIIEVTVTAPATADAGAPFVAHATVHFDGTTTDVFDPCPVFWTRISPQSTDAVTNSWMLHCAHMAPLRQGDVVEFDVPLVAPASLASQIVDLDLGFGLRPPSGPEPTTTDMGPSATTQLLVQGVGPPLQPVGYVALPPPLPPVPLRRLVSPPCAPRDLTAGNLAPHQLVPGAGVHSDYFTLTNVSAAPCTLYNNTLLVLTGPNLTLRPVLGGTSLFSETVNGELEPAETTEVQFEFPNSCDGVGAAAVGHYRQVVIQLPGGPLVVPRPIDDGCGVTTGGAGVEAEGPIATGPLYQPYQPTEPEIDGTANIASPPNFPRGVATTIEVTLEGQADWTTGCPGYVVTIAGVSTRHGLPCTIVHVLPDVPATYRIQVEPPPTAPLGATTISFELLSGLVPSDTQPATITAG